ncbi:sodium:alanine symporter [Campylobacter mucosalis]|uniref:Na+-dependent transporter, SNF family n=1 Tax=Campylobacter mucosalis CCUG 21559 TaxID=1032067 RepID=A0A6G5QGT9_9BACT|nr:sodium-dependent transporter [Campylobacter mucosalis]KEA46280.1 sodium:alanine symporter [Campylobacter mucosalis]QCD44834.1 Na+-dependent transporter, SNF family [Campylobacter mucosalis CCUG 21559]QKF62750.1 sodium-dependent transporter, SNF family [Campylobacter mucosalis]
MEKKEYFGKIGYVLAVAGSAVGLGAIWKFPYVVGANGGSAFVLLYIFMCALVAIPVFLAELSIGKLSESDAINSFRKLAVKHKRLWGYVGGMTMVTAAVISSYYLVIIGWVLKYLTLSFGLLPSDMNSSSGLFVEFLTKDWVSQFVFFAIAFGICILILSRGVKSGIEKISVWMMPALFLMLIFMLFYSFSMDGFGKAAQFLLIPDFSKITLDSFFFALGLAFFTMSLGMAVIITYSASLSDDTNLFKSTLSVVAINIIVAIIAGLVIFTFVFEYDATPGQGVGLVFMSLPTLFSNLGFTGNVLAVMFFIALSFAALTSAISIIEPFTFFLIREFGISRIKSLTFVGVGIFVLGILCIFANIEGVGEHYKIFDKDFFTFLDYTAEKILLPLGGIGGAIFAGYVIKKEALYTLFKPYMGDFIFKIWYTLIRFVVPVCVAIIMINALFFAKG